LEDIVTDPPIGAAGLDPNELSYYRLTESWNGKFWRRTNGSGAPAGAVCLDLGCGVGALTTDLVRLGAERAIGIDPDADRIRVARLAARAFHRDLADRVEYRAAMIQQLEGQAAFDMVVSRDTFEHIHDLPQVLREVARLLRPAGRFYVGFGPLYRSPFGDHGLLGLRLPWVHLLVAPTPDAPRFDSWPSRRRLDLLDRELNGLTLNEIEAIVERSPLQVESLRVNVSDHPGMRLLSLARRIPVLCDFVTVNVYAVLRQASRDLEAEAEVAAAAPRLTSSPVRRPRPGPGP
jgi:SAM-dependent methyltransferase